MTMPQISSLGVRSLIAIEETLKSLKFQLESWIIRLSFDSFEKLNHCTHEKCFIIRNSKFDCLNEWLLMVYVHFDSYVFSRNV